MGNIIDINWIKSLYVNSYATKRLFDIGVSASALLLLSPVFLTVALRIRLDSADRIFFSQIRVGKQGQTFRFWKFRTMDNEAEKHKAALMALNEMPGGTLFKMKKDPRITRVGRFLRQSSLDELPQFWNILKGDMSLVGPRPPLPDEVAHYTPYQRQRLEVAPGLTGLWQVSGRSEIPFAQQVEMDLEYMAKQSFWYDLVILLKTIPAVLKGRGAF